MLQVLHHQDQCRRGLALGNRADGLAGLGQVGAASTQSFGHGEGDQSMRMQALEVVMGEGAALIIDMRVAGQFSAEAFEQGFEVGDFHGA